MNAPKGMKYWSQQTIRFLLLDTLHAGVLAEAKPDWTAQALWQLVEEGCHSLHKKPVVTVPPVLEKWLLPKSLGGEESLSVFRAVILEHLLATDERLGWQTSLTAEVLHWAAQIPACQTLFKHHPASGWQGALMLPKLGNAELNSVNSAESSSSNSDEPLVRVVDAGSETAKAGSQLVKLHSQGFQAFAVPTQSQPSPPSQLFLLLAHQQDRPVLVLLPSMRVQDGRLVDNEVHALNEATLGAYALGENTHGFLIGELSGVSQELYANLNRWGQLHALGRLRQTVQTLQEQVQCIQKTGTAEPSPSLPFQQRWLTIQTLSEALRALVFADHFYKDCCQYSLNSEPFQLLMAAYQDLGQFYVPEQALNLQNVSAQLTAELAALKSFADLGEPQTHREPELLSGVLPMHSVLTSWQPWLVEKPALRWVQDSKIWSRLLKEFGELKTTTQSSLLKESYINFYAVVSKTLVLVDDWSNQKPIAELQRLHTRQANSLLGDLLAATQWLQQGAVIERQLQLAGLDINHFQDQACKDPQLQFYYNRLLQIEHFVLNHLMHQHGNIRSLERHSDAALATLG